MGYKGTLGKTNWVLGELSPRAFGQFSQDKPIYKDGAALLENMLIFQDGGVMFRPGTQYIAPTKSASNRVCLYRFTYSIAQEYVMEVGGGYIRFFANGAQVIVPTATAWVTGTMYVVGNYVSQGGNIYYCIVNNTSGVFATDLAAGKWVLQNVLEIPTIFQQSDLFQLQTANKADVMYICNTNYYPQKLIRTSATSFTISNVPFVRGPFLDTNATSTTISSSSDSGTISLSSSSPIFQLGHIGSLWLVGTDATHNGVVLITGYSNPSNVTGIVQNEASGAAGNLQTSGNPVAYWAEGAFSQVRGYPSSCTFHEERLIYAGTKSFPQTLYASQVGAYDNFDVGTALDADAWQYEISSNVVNGIRWLNSSVVGIKIGTSGGTITAADASNSGITPSAPPNIIFDTDFGVMEATPQTLDGFLLYLQNNSFSLRQLQPDLILSRDKSVNLNIVADHILRDGGGAVQIDRQQSPNTRIWVVRKDGQIAVLTHNTEQKITGWCRIIGSASDSTSTCNGLSGSSESICILPIDGQDDQIWVVCNRLINGSFVRWVEMFTDELFDNYWEPVRVDASLSYDNPVNITAISNTNPITVTAPGHGFSEFDLVEMQGIVGMEFLNGNTYQIQNVTTNNFDLYLVPS